jgi:hypothetical protein
MSPATVVSGGAMPERGKGVIRRSAWAVFDPRGVVGAERFLTPCIPDLEGVRLDVLDDTTSRQGSHLRCLTGPKKINRMQGKCLTGLPSPISEAAAVEDGRPIHADDPPTGELLAGSGRNRG